MKVRRILLVANCRRANKIWSASIVAGVFSLQNCGWLVGRFFFCLPEDILGQQYVTSLWAPVTKSRWHRPSLRIPVILSRWLRICSVTPVTLSRRSFWPLRVCSVTPVTMSRRSFWPEFRIVWLPKMPASGWGSLWESSSFVPWFVLNAFRDITGVIPDLPWISGFMRKSSFTWVKWVGNVSLYRNYPHTTQGIHMYSVVYPESDFEKNFLEWFQNGSGMVPEWFRNRILVDFPERFRNGSGNVP